MITRLYEKYHTELLRWCQGITGDRQSAEELVQETWLRALEHTGQLAALEEKQCRSWLYRTTKNLYVDRVRRTVRETVMCRLPDSGSWCREIEETEWRCLLEDLPEEEGRVFVMRYLMGYNSRQIGELLSLPPGTVRYKLSSARKRLRIMIGGNGYGEEKPDTEW